MRRVIFLTLLVILILTSIAAPVARGQQPPQQNQGEHDFSRWEKEVAAFEEMDRKEPPPKRAILFIGSSTIRLWKTLAQDFADHRVINRGFGGSEIVDATHFVERIVFPYEPRMIFLRAGGNDIHNGKSPEQVFADFKDFVAKVRTKLPDTEIVFVSLSPSPSRWSEAEKNKQLNTLIEAHAKQTPRLKYIETYDISLSPDGQPRPELFIEDKLHFNEEGYRLLAERVRPFLPKRIVSPEVHPDRRVTFRFKAPNAKQVMLNCETIKPKPMEKDAQTGVWSVTAGPFEPDVYVYSFLVDGLRVIDPNNPLLKYNLLSTENQVHVPGPESLPWEVNDVPHGVIHRHFFHSAVIGDERTFLVYTPPGYDPAAKEAYPVLYLLHGYSDAEDTWTTVGRAHVILDNLITRGKAKPMLVVMPFGYGNNELIGLGWELIRGPEADRPWQDSFTKFRASLFEELMPQVEKTYRASSDASHHAIAGLSMGGSQALFIGLNAPERFGWIGAFSSGGLKPDFDAQFPDAAEKSNAALRLLWVGCGTDDRLIESNRKLTAWLEAKGIAHTWVEKPGGHSFLVWRRFLAEFAPLLFQDVRDSRE